MPKNLISLCHEAESRFMAEARNHTAAQQEIIWFLKDVIIAIGAELRVHKPNNWQNNMDELQERLEQQLARVRESNKNNS